MGYFSLSGTHLNQGFIQDFELGGGEQDGSRMIVMHACLLGGSRSSSDKIWDKIVA